MKPLALITLFVISFAAHAGNNWQVVLDKDPLTNQTECLLLSTKQTTKDGQTTTPVGFIYNGKQFLVKTESNIDLSYADSGLSVDSRATHGIDRLYKKTDAVFESEADTIRDEFIRGLRARLTLGFWPTWPKTHSYHIDFDLRGFTAAYNQFQHCQKTGNAPANE